MQESITLKACLRNIWDLYQSQTDPPGQQSKSRWAPIKICQTDSKFDIFPTSKWDIYERTPKLQRGQKEDDPQSHPARRHQPQTHLPSPQTTTSPNPSMGSPLKLQRSLLHPFLLSGKIQTSSPDIMRNRHSLLGQHPPVNWLLSMHPSLQDELDRVITGFTPFRRPTSTNGDIED